MKVYHVCFLLIFDKIDFFARLNFVYVDGCVFVSVDVILVFSSFWQDWSFGKIKFGIYKCIFCMFLVFVNKCLKTCLKMWYKYMCNYKCFSFY